MEQGKLVELDTVDSIYQRPAHPYTKKLISAIPTGRQLTERSGLWSAGHCWRSNTSIASTRKETAFYPPENGANRFCRTSPFSLYQGEVLGLVGESSSRKTTLSRAIVGLLQDYTGELLLHTATPRKWCFRTPTAA